MVAFYDANRSDIEVPNPRGIPWMKYVTVIITRLFFSKAVISIISSGYSTKAN